MNGVTILNTSSITVDGFEIVFGFFVCIVACIAMVAAIAGIVKDHDIFSIGIWMMYIIMIMLTVFVLIMGIYTIIEGANCNDTTYEVTIDDNVSMTKFMSKYEIVEHRGEIYTIKEIES